MRGANVCGAEPLRDHWSDTDAQAAIRGTLKPGSVALTAIAWAALQTVWVTASASSGIRR